jgi:hypothetical protein
LAELMDVGTESRRVWRPEELGAILRHQMSAAVLFDISSLKPSVAPKLKALSEAEGLLVRSFNDLLQHPNPPIELLQLTKEFAKANRDHPESPLPQEIASVLYFGSIAAALVRCGERITRLDDAPLRKGMQWVIDQPWVDTAMRSLAEAGLKKIGH